jgi:hypothetical protein
MGRSHGKTSDRDAFVMDVVFPAISALFLLVTREDIAGYAAGRL